MVGKFQQESRLWRNFGPHIWMHVVFKLFDVGIDAQSSDQESPLSPSLKDAARTGVESCWHAANWKRHILSFEQVHEFVLKDIKLPITTLTSGRQKTHPCKYSDISLRTCLWCINRSPCTRSINWRDRTYSKMDIWII